ISSTRPTFGPKSPSSRPTGVTSSAAMAFSAPQQLGHAEGEVERLAGVQAGVAHRLVAGLQLVGEDFVGAAEALGHVVAGQLDVDPARPGPLRPVDGEVAPDLGHHVLEVPGL